MDINLRLSAMSRIEGTRYVHPSGEVPTRAQRVGNKGLKRPTLNQRIERFILAYLNNF